MLGIRDAWSFSRYGLIGQLVVAVIGALLLLFLVRSIKRAGHNFMATNIIDSPGANCCVSG